MSAGHPQETASEVRAACSEACTPISELLSRVGDKWTVLVIQLLAEGPRRFNALRREIGDISQKMLSSTLRNLERDGFVSREVAPTTPPQVTYRLTAFGEELQAPVSALARWTHENTDRIDAARRAFDAAQRDRAA
jgi:DNA-binding HxlR family transcriptional regulator